MSDIFNSNIEMEGNKVVGLADPSNPQEAATKAYVDSKASVDLYYAFVKDDTGLINNGTGFAQYIRLNFTTPSTGLYEIHWHYVWSLNNNANDFRAQVQMDDGLFLDVREHTQEAKDSAGTGETLPLVGGGTLNSGTNQRHTAHGFDVQTIAGGVHFIDIDIACSSAGIRAAIYGARISVRRVG